jgi:hypothetical protein
MSGTLCALRQAATVLLAEASLPVVRATLRALLAETETAAPARAASPPLQEPRQPRRQAKATPKSDGTWDVRRREIRAAMLERSVSYRELADQFGVAVQTLRHALGRRQPPTQAMRQKLEAWTESGPAPAVAAKEQPFRTNGAGRVHTDAGIAAADDGT